MKRIAGFFLPLVVLVPACVSSGPETNSAPPASSSTPGPAPTVWKWQERDPALAFVENPPPVAAQTAPTLPPPEPIEEITLRGKRAAAVALEDMSAAKPEATIPPTPLSPELLASTPLDRTTKAERTDKAAPPAPILKSPAAASPTPADAEAVHQVAGSNVSNEDRPFTTAQKFELMAKVDSPSKITPPAAPTANNPAPVPFATNPPSLPPMPGASALTPPPAPPETAAPAPTHANTTLVRMVNSKRITLNFEVKEAGPSGVAGVDLWTTKDCRDWHKQEVSPQNGAFIVQVPEEGMYGFSLVAHSGVGMAKDPPSSGDLPQVWVVVDLTRPTVQALDVTLSSGKTRTLTVHWKATDANLGHQPITLSYAEKEPGPWLPIAANLENSGCYAWQLPASVPPRVLVRVEAIDLAGNIGQATTSRAAVLDMARPEVSIVTVEPSTR
jgi:hypothetical protein